MAVKKIKTPKEKGLSIDDTLAKIKAKFGNDSVMMLSDKPNSNIDKIPTGTIGLDYAIGIGGYPRGRIIEIYGAESSGKTTLALHAIAEAQKMGLTCAFIDAEHALDVQYAEKLGVKNTQLVLSQPNGGEEALQIADALVSSGKVALVVVDSVAALTPKCEIDGEIGDMSVGAQARLMSQMCRMLSPSLARTKAVIIFINQVRANIGGYGNPETTAGGKALKFYASVRIDVRKISTIKKGEEAVGSRIRCKVVKNKVAAPFKVTEYDIIYNEGITKEGEILAVGESLKVLGHASTGAYTFGEIKLGRGYDASRTFLKENPTVLRDILSAIQKCYDDK